MVLRALLALALLAPPAYARQNPPDDALTTLLVRLEEAAAAGNSAAILALAASAGAPGVDAFAAEVSPPPERFVIKERDRSSLPGVERLLLEIFAQFGQEAVISTWRMDVSSAQAASAPRITEMEQLTRVSGLYRLGLDPNQQYQVRNLTVEATDLTLQLPSGQAFVAQTPDGATAVVLLGRGRMRFAPSDPAERTQIRIFADNEVLTAEFDSVFVRIRPSEFSRIFSDAALTPQAVVPGQLRRAVDVFEDHVGQTLSLDLTDLSRERWSLVPTPGDLIAEIRTRRHGNLTYARSLKDAEDISLFDRRRRRNISVYASQQKLASRGRFYSEDDLVEYDVLEYDIDASFNPDRLWVDGNARLKIKIRSYALTALTLRLAEPLAVRGISSAEHGRLLHLRVVGQNSVLVNFPTALTRDTELSLQVIYGGRLEAQQIDQESVALSAQGQGAQTQLQEHVYIPIEAQYVYSNRSYWYPQATVTDYATARLRLQVPSDTEIVAVGTRAGPPTAVPATGADGDRARRVFVFSADRPVRYLSCVISRFRDVGSRRITIPGEAGSLTTSRETTSDSAEGLAGGPSEDGAAAESTAVMLDVQANPRQMSRARALGDRAASMIEFYGTLVGEAPYPTFTLAVTEHELPGGHSPAYFAMVNQPHPMSALVWRNDPVAFDNYPLYFLAHEVAHQWWGQGVGWKNYHEQWLSEGFAQYFAVLYAANDRGADQLTSMLRQMRRWAEEQSSQGPVYLGYRLGHIKADGRVFRAVLYNKSAMVLHMLRRLVGDEDFFAGVRLFYSEWKFRKAGTDDFRAAIERVSGRDLSPFFEAWIYATNIPELKFTSVVEGQQARIRFEHRGALIPVPVTVSITYSDGQTDEIVVPVTEQVVERMVPLRGTVRAIDANRDHGALAEIGR